MLLTNNLTLYIAIGDGKNYGDGNNGKVDSGLLLVVGADRVRGNMTVLTFSLIWLRTLSTNL